MKKLMLCIALGLFCLSLSSCASERIDAGHVGIKVNMYGDSKGVDDIALVTGRVWYNPWTTQVFEIPTFMQNAVWTADQREGSKTNQSITFQTNEGLEVTANIALNYSLDSQLVPQLFKKFRKDPLTLQNTYLRTQVRNIFVTSAAKYSIEDFIKNKSEFLKEVQQAAIEKLTGEGFVIDTLTFIGSPEYPPSVVKAIKNKINATQIAQQKQRELEQAQADAAKAQAEAKGKADAAIEKARGEAETIRLKAIAEADAIRKVRSSLTPTYVDYLRATRWNGEYPGVMAGEGTGLLLSVNK